MARIPAANRAEGKAIRDRLKGLGVLSDSGHEWFRGSLVIPVRDAEGRVVQAYPKSHGGNATITNGQVSCPHCNMSSGNGPHPVTSPVGYEGSWPPPHWPS